MPHTKAQELAPFLTDPADELPVGVQLSWQLRASIATGWIASGEQLPSIRVLAAWSGLNANTVRAVYAGLERRGLVVSHQGLGTFVADTVAATPRLETVALEALRDTKALGFDPRELATVIAGCAMRQAHTGSTRPTA